MLANNAGAWTTADMRRRGLRRSDEVNHLAPFLLTRLLLDTLIGSRASVIQTSSTVRFAGTIDLEDLDNDRHFDAVRAYGAAKLENILFTTELHRRYHASGISAASLYPGNVATNFAAEATNPIMRFVRFLSRSSIVRRVMLSTPDQGADQIVWLAEGRPGTDWQSGAYYYKRRASKPANKQALDAELARGLWERSEKLLAGRL